MLALQIMVHFKVIFAFTLRISFPLLNPFQRPLLSVHEDISYSKSGLTSSLKRFYFSTPSAPVPFLSSAAVPALSCLPSTAEMPPWLRPSHPRSSRSSPAAVPARLPTPLRNSRSSSAFPPRCSCWSSCAKACISWKTERFARSGSKNAARHADALPVAVSQSSRGVLLRRGHHHLFPVDFGPFFVLYYRRFVNDIWNTNICGWVRFDHRKCTKVR